LRCGVDDGVANLCEGFGVGCLVECKGAPGHRGEAHHVDARHILKKIVHAGESGIGCRIAAVEHRMHPDADSRMAEAGGDLRSVPGLPFDA